MEAKTGSYRQEMMRGESRKKKIKEEHPPRGKAMTENNFKRAMQNKITDRTGVYYRKLGPEESRAKSSK